MAFDINGFQRWSDGVAGLGNNLWEYTSSVDALATIQAANYFDSLVLNANGVANPDTILRVGDVIYTTGTDGGNFAVIATVTPHVTITPFDVNLGVGNVNTANIANLAVTGAKMANNTITDTQVGVNALTSAALDKTTIQYAKVAMTAAQWNGMYAAPFLLVAAPGANKQIIVRGAVLAMTFVSAQYAAGGAVALQYDSTVHGAGPLASATVAAATVNGYAASSDVGVTGADTSGASAAKVNKGLYISNDTAAFTTGDGTWNIHVWYEVVTL
jgi:hypothetical protein